MMNSTKEKNKNNMKRIDLIEVEHNHKVGKDCPYFEPNIKEDCLFVENGEVIGFFLRRLPEKAGNLADVANAELLSDRVPKSEMERSDVMAHQERLGLTRREAKLLGTTQFSTIIGSIPPKAHMRRYAPNHSSVHTVKSAGTFIKAMWKLAVESEKIIKEITPLIWEKQIELFKEVPDEWKFGNIFTSSISNFNISAPFHRDVANLRGAVNVIITKRINSKGGNLHLPDYGATIDQCDNSMLVYPAWKSLHGVTPIIPTHEGGYRNSLVFYPLGAFTREKLSGTNNNEE